MRKSENVRKRCFGARSTPRAISPDLPHLEYRVEADRLHITPFPLTSRSTAGCRSQPNPGLAGTCLISVWEASQSENAESEKS